jgi:hypothetical protein
MASNKKMWLWVGVLGGGALLWYMMSKHNAGAAQLLPPPTAAALPGNTVSADILSVASRITPDQQAKLQALVASLNAADYQMLDSIAHSFNNGIPLTPAQTQWWATNGVF